MAHIWRLPEVTLPGVLPASVVIRLSDYDTRRLGWRHGQIRRCLSPRPGVAVVACTGEHDLTTKDETGRLLRLLVAENDLVVVDVSQAQFIDSSFVNNLLKADRLARERGTAFRLQLATAPTVSACSRSAASSRRSTTPTTRDEALRPAADAI